MSGLLARFTEAFREGTADLLGYGAELETLREAAADSKLLARRVEDAVFGDLFGSRDPGEQEAARWAHRETVKRAYLYYFGDPIIRRTVDLQTFYVLGTGITRPTYSPPGDKAEAGQLGDGTNVEDAAAKAGQDVVNAIWEDDENKLALTGVLAQYQKSLELQVQANLFFRLFPRGEGETGGSPLKISDLPETEIVDIIRHPANDKVPLYYLREFTPRIWSHQSNSYTPGQTKLMYYLDWSAEPPKDGEEFDGVVWQNPPEDKIGDGFVYHVKVNCTSHMRFGISELQSYLDAGKGLNAYMTSRMSIVQALAAIAMQLKVSGGPRAASQQAAKLQELTRLAANVDEGAPTRQRGSDSQTKVAVTNRGAELQPMVADTGAAGAATDIATMKGQVAAGSGIPVTHLGGEAAALAGGIAQDVSLHRLVLARQTLWKDIVTDIIGFGLKRAGIDPDGLKVTLPPVTERDVGMVITNLVALITGMDPTLQNRPLQRFILREVLDALGKEDAAEMVDAILPLEDPTVPGWPPDDPNAGQNDTGAAGQNEPPASGGHISRRKVADRLKAAVETNARAARANGLRQTADRGSASTESNARLNRATDRTARALEAMPAELVEVALDVLAEIDEVIGVGDARG